MRRAAVLARPSFGTVVRGRATSAAPLCPSLLRGTASAPAACPRSVRAFRTTALGLQACSKPWVWGMVLAGGLGFAVSTARPVHAATAATDGDENMVKEERSGFLFPRKIRLDGSTEGHVLAVGVRKMYVIFTTYAIGLYVSPNDVKRTLSKFKDMPPEELKKNQELFDTLKDGAFTKMIRLIPTSDTSGSHLRNGLVSAVAARMKDKKEEALKQFGNFFPNELKKGMIIDFLWKKGGELAVLVDGQEVGVVTSPAIGQAFFEVYLGAKTKTPDVRDKWAFGLAEWLRA